MRIKSIVKASSLAVCWLVPAMASGQMPADISAYMPSKAEMRQGLVEAGMTPAQIETILSSMDFPEEDAVQASDKPTPCIDENANDICDADETDPVITQCRKVYQTELYATSRGLYGDSMGRNAIEVAQTCSMAAAGGAMTKGYEDGASGWHFDMDKLMETSSYWTAILSHGRYLSDTDFPEIDNMDEAQLQEMMSSFPRDLQAMMRAAGSEDLKSIAMPIHNKCERLRSRVGSNYRNNVLVDKVCVDYVPDKEPADE